MKIYVAESPADINQHISGWEELIKHQIDDDIFATPSFLIPLIKNFKLSPFKFLFIYKENDTGKDVMILAAAFSIVGKLKKIPVKHISTLIHDHIASLHPIIHRDYAGQAVRLLIDWLEKKSPGHIAALRQIFKDSNFYKILVSELDIRGKKFSEKIFERAVMKKAPEGSDYLRMQMSGKKLKKLRRYNKQLAQRGTLEHTVVTTAQDVGKFLENFYRLEKSSWKGGAGTALASKSHDENFFSEMALNFAQTGNICFMALVFNGKPVAMQCNFSFGSTLFAYKTAYDPAFSKYSPGILLEIEMMQYFQKNKNLLTADSCSKSGSYIESIWKERKEMANIFFPTSLPGRILLAIKSQVGVFFS